jgi:uncharacterized GH25 family protein
MPSAPTTCAVTFYVYNAAIPVQNATVTISLEDANSSTVDMLVSRQQLQGVTDSNGTCVLNMIQYGQFTRGGIYRIQIADQNGRLIHNRRVKVPSVSSCKAVELIDA